LGAYFEINLSEMGHGWIFGLTPKDMNHIALTEINFNMCEEKWYSVITAGT
jgi:hypothetical protein